MKIQEVCSQCHVTKKAIYYYEKQQLLHVYKNQNGYREFNDEDIQRLKEIVMYRSWSISIADIRYLLDLDIDKKKIQLKESIKSLGTHIVTVKLHPEVSAELKVVVKEEA